MDKLRFEFVVKPSEDPKTNIICLTSLTDVRNYTYLLPEALQSVKLHETLVKTQAYKKVRNTLQKRHDKRQVWITLTPEISQEYIDEDGNICFKGYLLEEIPPEQQQTPSAGISEVTLTKILESFVETKKDISNLKSIRKLSEKIVIEKFNRLTSNVSQWIEIFERECIRNCIDEDSMKIEALRFFIEDSCLDWYSSMLIKYTVDSQWLIWKENFCETFAARGWSSIRYAILFKYKQGSLLEYALKKEKLLLEINKLMDKPTLIDLIATGLPNFIADKIDRSNLKETKDLFNNLRGLEHLVFKSVIYKRTKYENKTKENCKNCEKENKGIRYHPESICWFKTKTSDRPKGYSIKNVNNYELETELNEINPKN